jgi:predicted aldo/keto reductase-like oxidoreductase
VDVLRAVLEDGFYDAVLVAVNFRSPKELFETIEETAAEGVGIIAMKTQNGGYKGGNGEGEWTPHQAALRHVLEKPGIHLAIPGMLSRAMVEQNTAAVKGKGGLADLVALEAFRTRLEGNACAFCSECIDQCRYGTGGVDAVRVAMYVQGYGDPGLAGENARAAAEAIGNCLRCEECTVRCGQSIDIQNAARRAASFLC